MNTPAQRFNEARAYCMDKGLVDLHLFIAMMDPNFLDESITDLSDLWNSRIEPTAEHLDIIERIEAIVTKLQTT